MDERNWGLSWLEWAIIIALVVLVVIAGLMWIGPQFVTIHQSLPENL